MRGKENLVLIRAAKGGLMLHVMYYADEVRDFAEIDKGHATTTEAELNLALRLIEELSETEFQPDLFHDEYRERVLAMIQQKAEGKEISLQPQAKPAAVVDLMQALKASLEKGPKKAKPAAAKATRAEGASAKRHVARR
jgi:DNA end-binding protein Ku